MGVGTKRFGVSTGQRRYRAGRVAGIRQRSERTAIQTDREGRAHHPGQLQRDVGAPRLLRGVPQEPVRPPLPMDHRRTASGFLVARGRPVCQLFHLRDPSRPGRRLCRRCSPANQFQRQNRFRPGICLHLFKLDTVTYWDVLY